MDEGSVAFQSARPFDLANSKRGKMNPAVISSSKEYRSGLGWAHLQGRAVADDRVRAEEPHYGPQISLDDNVSVIRQVAGIQSSVKLAEFSPPYSAVYF
jgi:hypothetical protein